MSRKLKRRFKRFIRLWLLTHLNPLTEEEIPSFETWLSDTPYPQSRKVELTRVWDKANRRPDKSRFRKVKSFIKDETYPDWKYPRLINSRVDEAKCYFGPVVQAVSDVLFSRPEFIKKVPVPDRPQFIRDTLFSSGLDSDYVFTDYTAFEAHFTKEVMTVTQVELFKHMLKKCPDKREWMKYYELTMTGKNELAFKSIGATLLATRMSGEMDTSLSNGFSNLMLIEFLVRENGGKVVGVVEGDDGLFRISPATSAPTTEQFADLGFTIKIAHTKELSEASFCGQVYDMTDLVVVTDIAEVLYRIGWTNKKYTKCSEKTALQLLRAKGFSLVYQYRNCPILDVLGRRILDLTAGVEIPESIYMNMDQWERSKLRAAVNQKLPILEEPGENTRQLVEKLYGITIAVQLELESEFRSLEFGHHDISSKIAAPQSWVDYFHHYSTEFHTNDPVWLLKPESSFLERLAVYPNCAAFIASIA